ncbi:hypothetical protein ASF64_18585 [Arthrobacter sp. Leaf137]|nr:hypothetical protein ASF64_18585 [Arthrobacter sp. Leaf137]
MKATQLTFSIWRPTKGTSKAGGIEYRSWNVRRHAANSMEITQLFPTIRLAMSYVFVWPRRANTFA